jgi:hypothetical protein
MARPRHLPAARERPGLRTRDGDYPSAAAEKLLDFKEYRRLVNPIWRFRAGPAEGR